MCTHEMNIELLYIYNKLDHTGGPKRLINSNDFLSKQNLLNLNFGLPWCNIDDCRFRVHSLFRGI